MSKVLVIGGSGFLGSHVADCLIENNHKVTIFDKSSNLYFNDKQKFIKGDTLSSSDLSKAIKGNDIVYNFSGISEIDEVKKNPIEGVKQNILSNVMILDLCKKYKIKRYIFGSSIYVHSNSGNFYKSTKIACESLIESYEEVYGLNYTILRYGSIYGLRSDNRNGIYNFIFQAIKDKKINFNGKSDALREYIHVLDASRISVEILNKKYTNKHIILTGNQSTKIKDLITMIKNILNNNKIKVTYKETKNSHYHMTPYSYNPKFGIKLTSNPSVDLGQGLLEIINDIKTKSNNDKK